MMQPAARLRHLSEGNFEVTGHAGQAWNIFRHGIVATKSG
jgi:hypothetical protein